MKSYNELINSILETRGRFNCGDEYHETHHILPRCCGGLDDEDNLIDLFAREHFEAHRLLALENPDNDKLIYAWWCMSTMQNEYEDRYQITAEEYEEARIYYVKLMKEKMSGNNNPMANRPWWDENTPQEKINEWKNNIIQATKNRWEDPEFRKKMSQQRKGKNCGELNPMYGKVVSQETRDKISQSSKDRWQDDKYREKVLEHLQGESNPFYGKHHSEKVKNILSEKAKERYLLYGHNKSHYTKSVVQLSLNEEFVAEYPSIREAEKITNIKNISNCCCGRYKTAGGFKWIYKEEYNKLTQQNDLTGDNNEI